MLPSRTQHPAVMCMALGPVIMKPPSLASPFVSPCMHACMLACAGAAWHHTGTQAPPPVYPLSTHITVPHLINALQMHTAPLVHTTCCHTTALQLRTRATYMASLAEHNDPVSMRCKAASHQQYTQQSGRRYLHVGGLAQPTSLTTCSCSVNKLTPTVIQACECDV